MKNSNQDNKHPVLRKCQLKQLEILKELDRICKKNNIDYWLDSGTLLGAVRHGGFIPWDDDIDVVIPLDQCKKLESIFQNELKEGLFFQTQKTDPTYPNDSIKIRLNGSLQIEDYCEMNAPYHKGIFIDILPFIYYPKLSKSLTKKLVKLIQKNIKRSKIRSKNIMIDLIKKIIGTLNVFLLNILWGLLTLKKSKYQCYRVHENFGNNRISSNFIYPLSKIKFERYEFSAPCNPDKYLKSIYGDSYMELPPIEKRQVHSLLMIPEIDFNSNEYYLGLKPDFNGNSKWGLR